MVNKIGIGKEVGWGFLGVVVFMMGEGVEEGWVRGFLVEKGLRVEQSGWLFRV